MKNWLAFLIFALILISPFCLNAQSKVGTTGAPFLTIGVGSRPLGMGSAFTAMVDDVHALFWNPAGLTGVERRQALLTHNSWLAGINIDYLGATYNLGRWGAVGVSAEMLSYGDMEVTTVQNQEGAGLYFNAYDLAVAGHYAYRFYDRFSLGGTVKYVHQSIWNETASSMAFDLGTLFITPLADTRLGMCISNFGSKMQMSGRDLLIFHDPDETRSGNNDRVTGQISSGAWMLPLTLRLGIANELLETPSHRLSAAIDWVVPNDNSEFLNIGAEYAFQRAYFLRCGYRGLRPGTYDEAFSLKEKDNGAGPTFGAGVVQQLGGGMTINVDYAFESLDRLGATHKYSLGLGF